MNEQITQRFDNRREYCRVDAFLPFTFRVVEGAEGKNLPCRGVIFSAPAVSPLLPELDNPALTEWFRIIHAKLDEIIKLLTLGQGGFLSLPIKPINISGNGLCFNNPESLPLGAVVETQIILTSGPPLPLYLVGEVVVVEPADKGYRIAIRFINIDETIRNEIIRFVFAREREILREKKGF